MAGHAAFWLASFLIASGCLLRAWKVGANGLDDDGVFKDANQYNWTTVWALAGVGLMACALVDMFTFFNPPPASLR
jgi:hypothetical protein